MKYILILLILVVFTFGISEQIKCEYCGKMINGTYVTSEGRSYHNSCYTDHIQPRCDFCNEPIVGTYTLAEGKQYHPDCYTDHILPKCDICNAPLSGKYMSDYWGNIYHEYHVKELSECDMCGRLICTGLTGGGYVLGDGRHLCEICNRTIVTTNTNVEASLTYVKWLFLSKGIADFPDDIQISLVDQPTLKRLSKSHSDGTQGFTDQRTQTQNGRIISRESHIYILSHLPLILFQAVLAHELLHVYLFEHEHTLSSDIREGFCNLGSEMVYSSTDSEFSNFQLQSMQASKNPDYGDGYRKMSTILHKEGWSFILKNIESIH